MTRRSRATSAGVPSAIASPWWSTTMRWARRIIAAMTCSITISVRPSACRSRISSMIPVSSDGVRPAITSSRRRRRGRVASARATSRRLRRAIGSALARAWACGASPHVSTTRSASRRAALTRRSLVSAPIITLSTTERLPKGFTSWNVRVRPRRQITCGGRPPTSRPSKTTRPPAARKYPPMTLKSVVLPAPFGPMLPKWAPLRTASLTARTALRPPKRSPDRRHRGGERHRVDLQSAARDAGRLGGVLVLAAAGELVAEARALEPDLDAVVDERDDEGHVDPGDVAQAERSEAGTEGDRDPLRAGREAAPAAREDQEHLGERDRGEREVGAAEAIREVADHPAGDDRERDPEEEPEPRALLETRRHQGGGVGADAEEGGVAERALA